MGVQQRLILGLVIYSEGLITSQKVNTKGGRGYKNINANSTLYIEITLK